MQFRMICSILSGALLSLALFTAVKAAKEEEEKVAPAARSLSSQLEEKGLKLGSPVFLRVYKQSSDLEVWLEKGPRYVLFKTYKICRWSGGLGPKMQEGDRQSPEGLYHIGPHDLIANARWHRAMNINYPNSFDLLNGRSGSGILIHGKCRSIGCFALNDQNVEEVYDLAEAAFNAGQARIPVLSLPFRMNSASAEKASPPSVNEFWSDLRRADFLFERDKLPPTALLCDGRYYFVDRRGDRRGHAVKLPDCRPLERPVTAEEVAKATERKKLLAALADSGENPKQAVENAAESCDPKSPGCRLLRTALHSSVICPKKYPRCRTAHAAYSKSAECPLKYPRCRFFVGPDPHLKSAHNANKVPVRR